ncbi:MAG: site-specific integrase [Victivallales bacterium]|nr:site-specific integrase [Victivallales bacterium]
MAGMRQFSTEQCFDMLTSLAFREIGDVRRNRAMFCVQLCLGCRVNEMLKLTLHEVLDGKGHIRDSWTFIKTKNGKNRTVKVLNRLVFDFLPDWLERLAELGYTDIDDPLFPGRNGEKGISDRQVRKIYAAAIEELGLDGRYSTHSCRKTWACQTFDYLNDQLRRGANISPLDELANLGGWDSVDAARRYIADHISRAAESQQAIYSDLRELVKIWKNEFRKL